MLNRWNFWFKPDSMRWFSHRRRTGGRKAPEDRSRKSLSTCTAVILSPPAATQWYSLLLHAAYGAVAHTLLCIVNGNDSAVFCPWWPWPFTFDPQIRIRARFMYNAPKLTAKFRHPTFNRSEVMLRTNWQTDKQTDAAENIHLASLRYAGVWWSY